ncbi:hexosaminidase [Dysgonomonas alginatilytica]|uniref:beta-N-acetylhexosaminidase n=1 Tax=Dysgonomonas alginatilytica TaxID=1605892 RepID=A0A2V3PNI5_9BACT|nr:family 20 glycosylhydrolase [Dysgonomonas alginatilytica]PXV64152.1 hexosaminidase [Dysgonomonas alginatilytica]
MLKKLIPVCTVALAMLVSSCGSTETPIQKPYNEGINVTPIPLELKQNEGNFELTKSAVFAVNDPSLDKVASYFAAKIKNSTGYDLDIKTGVPSSNFISLNLDKDIAVNGEGYLVEVTEKGIDIKAKTPQGVFYAMQTVMQLLPAEIESPTLIKYIAWKVPNVSIKDEPRFPYRGQHLDVCRHFADVDYLKKQLDVLAMFKINTFHWHLTEDQAWRIEIKKYPKLTEIGSKRVEGDGSTYGPYFYTQDQVKEIVAYAKERFIEVIPEIELPGHGVAALAAYPELSCTGGPFEVRNIWGVANDVYCAGNDSVFQFLTDVIEEVIPLFESDYFHIGGDECPKIRWEKCPKCQARIKELGLKSDKEHSAEERLQSYFVQRMEKVLLKHNKKMIGWDEILEGGLAPTAAVMSWRGEEGGIAAANMGHDVIMTPGGWLYLDKYQGDSKILPVTIGGLLTLEKTYDYEPIPEKIADDKKHHILGAQGNVWAEYMYDTDRMENMTFPRIIAVAEVNWSAKDKKDYKDFERRMNNQLVRLDFHGINYFIPNPEQTTPSANFVVFLDSTTLEFKTSMPVKFVYTTDGTEPTLASAVYEKPLTFKENTTLKIRTVLMSEKMGETRTITIEKQSPAPAVQKAAGEKPGLKAEHFKGVARKMSDLEGKTPDEVEYVASPQKTKHRVNDYVEVYPNDFYSTILTGYIDIPEDGVYYFSTDSELWIDGKQLITNDNGKDTARRFSRADKSIALAKGLHAVKIVRFGAIFGGWPTQWDVITVSMRADKDKEFSVLNEKSFK